MSEFNNKDVDVHNINSLRLETSIKEFTLSKGTGILHILFESFPIWLLALSPFTYKSICFPQYKSFNDITSTSHLSKVIMTVVDNTWLSSSVLFKEDSLPSPNFICISGSAQFIKNLDSKYLSAPALCVFEYKNKVRSLDSRFKFRNFRHFVNGGCSSVRIQVGFFNVDPPSNLPCFNRTLADFLDYSILPSKAISHMSIKENGIITPSSIWNPKQIEECIAMPCYKFSTGWGIRLLERKEIFSIWGWSKLCSSRVSLIDLLKLTPIQPLSLILNAYLKYVSPQVRRYGIKRSTVPQLPIATKTLFPSINREISHEWIEFTHAKDKSDAAPIPSAIWDKRIQASFLSHPDILNLATKLRELCLRYYRRSLMKSFCAFLRRNFDSQWSAYLLGNRSSTMGGMDEFSLSLKAGIDVIKKAAKATWFEWLGGSTLVFWRWNQWESVARDGFPMFMLSQPSKKDGKRIIKSSPPSSLPLRKLYIEKITKIITSNYLELGWVKWCIRCFGVSKGPFDIRLVFDGTKSGINAIVWVPSFFLPTSGSLGRQLQVNTYQMDLDIGEMFLNFPLFLSIRKLCGVDLSLFDEIVKEFGSSFFRWCRTWMGFRPSPYLAVRFLALAVEMAIGNPHDDANPFYWSEIVLNLPCSDDFDPSMPWIYKWNDIVKAIAGDLISFVDDFRITGYSVENCWQCGRRLASRLQHLGIQEAARKRTPPSLLADPWAGAIIKTFNEVTKTVSQEKWSKAKVILADLRSQIGSPDHLGLLSHKTLEQSRGFLNHLSLTYEIICPYLRGFHNSIDGWRDNRDVEGWKSEEESSKWADILFYYRSNYKITSEEYDQLLATDTDDQNPPPLVLPAPRLFSDLKMLENLFKGETPAVFPVRFERTAEVIYGFFDASGTGLGSMMQGKDANKVHIRIGVWSAAISDEKSSNWREFANLVKGVVERAKKGLLRNTLLFLFTDNSTVEAAIAKGNSSSPYLFELVIELKTAEMMHGFRAHVIHISGDRMIAQGTDGVSRGDNQQGSILSQPLRNFAPMHLSAMDRNDSLLNWIIDWSGPETFVLEPKNWFYEAHDLRANDSTGVNVALTESCVYLWSPPPAIADVALEQLRYARLKRQSSVHIFVVPKLFLNLWRRQFFKAIDLILTVPPRFSFWPAEMFEPLLIGFCFPFIRFKPWSIKGTPKLVSIEREVQKMWKEEGMDGRDCLREFLLVARKLPSVSESVVRSLLYFE